MSRGWTAGGLLSAALSSICCTGPLLFSLLGVGAGATGFLGESARFAAALAPYRLFFVVLAVVFLALGYRSVYRQQWACAPGSGCAPDRLKHTKALLWVATVIIVAFALAPYWLAIGS